MTYTFGPATVWPTTSPVVLVQVTVVLPAADPAVFATTLAKFTVLLFQSSPRRVFHVVPPSGETCMAHWQLLVAARSRVCTQNSTDPAEPLVLMALVVVNMVSVRLAVPPLNSAAAPDATMVKALPAVVGATFIVNAVALVTEATVALAAKPVPANDMPLMRPAVLSQVTATLAAVVTALVRVTPAAVRVRPVPVAEAA